MQTEQARLVAEAQREAENRMKNTQASIENELTIKDNEIRKIQQAGESLKSDHDRSLEELVQYQNQTRKQESRIKTLEIQLKDSKDDLDESQAQLQESSHSL